MSTGVVEQHIRLPELRLTFRNDGSSEAAGIRGWTFSRDDSSQGGDVETLIDGISTLIVADAPVQPPDMHRLAVTGVDHVVVMTGSLERTCAAITETIGDPLRRVRDAGRGVRQGFHRAGHVIIEVVERPDLDSESRASLWGFVLSVEDLDGAVAWLGPDVISQPRDAVQPGRRIATVRSEAGLGVPLALMTPHAGS